MRKELKISVIIPAYNAEKTITKCLSSVVSQKVKPFEIIVVDDGSSDNTMIFAKKFAKVIKNVLSKGPSGARNTGAKFSKGEVLTFTDSDCILNPDWLTNISKVFKNSEIGAVGGGYSSGIDKSFWQEFCTNELNYRRKNWHGYVKTLVSNNMAVRRSIFLKEGGFPERYPVCEDMLLSFKISLRYKVLWLRNNGVIHHFKDSLKGFLLHQFNFGKESTKFFLENPNVLALGNHQGRSLHLAIIIAFLFVLDIILLTFFAITRSVVVVQFLTLLFIALVFFHFLIYLGFIKYLLKINFKGVVKSYLISLLRDIIVSFSFFLGFIAFLKSKQNSYL